MKTVGQIVTEVSGQLNDQKLGREFIRWTRARLLSYLNGALAEISGYRPDAFVTTISHTLVAGRKQQLAAPYKQVIAVNANSDGSSIHETDLDLLKAFTAYSACTTKVQFDSKGNPDYKAKSAAKDPKDPTVFYLSPEVPKGVAASVEVEVQVTPDRYTLNDWGEEVPVDPKYDMPIWDYMMGRALEIDTESRESRVVARQHLSQFWQFLGVKYKQESKFEAGWYRGAIGEGDKEAGR